MLAAIYHSPVIRLIPVGLVLMGLQNTLFVDMRPFGVVLQVMLAAAVAAGAAGGSERGAIAAFVLGLMYDLGLGTPIGVSAISFGLGAVVAGWIFLIRIERRWWLNALFVLAGAAVAEFSVPVMRLLLGDANAMIESTWRIVLIVALGAAVLSPMLVPLMRWSLRIGGEDWTPKKMKTVGGEST